MSIGKEVEMRFMCYQSLREYFARELLIYLEENGKIELWSLIIIELFRVFIEFDKLWLVVDSIYTAKFYYWLKMFIRSDMNNYIDWYIFIFFIYFLTALLFLFIIYYTISLLP